MAERGIYLSDFPRVIQVQTCFEESDIWSYDILNIPNREINSLAPGGFDYSLKLINFELISMMNISSIVYEIAIRWTPQHLPDH